VQFVDDLGDREQLGDRTERFPPEVHVGTGDDDTQAPIGEVVDDTNQATVQKLRLVDADDLRFRPNELGDLKRRGYGLRLDAGTVVRTDPLDPTVPPIQVRLEDLDVLSGDHGTTQAAQQFL
jgi:hypothetical protein